MSDVEEPPTKMSKYEEYLKAEVEEGMEEGQEEWLSEGVLTDDDYNPVTEQDKNHSNLNTSQEDHAPAQNLQENSSVDQNTNPVDQVDGVDQVAGEDQVDQATVVNMKTEANVERTLTVMDDKKTGDELPDTLDAFLIRKTDGKVLEAKVMEETELKVKQEEEDGNDTDDLLRMLEEGDQKTKKKIKLIKSHQDDEQGSSDDDEFVYERSKVKTLKLAKNALIKRAPAVKAEPEDLSDGDDETDQSSDECATVERMFEVSKKPGSGLKGEPPKRIVKHVVQVNTNFNKIIAKPEIKPNKQITQPKPILKTPQKQTVIKHTTKSVDIQTPSPFKPMEKNVKLEKNLKMEKDGSTTYEFEEIIDEEEFLEDDEIDLDEEEFAEESEGDESKKQRIMNPERMDEEVPSDGESHSEDGSLYDELPSSDSEDNEDWFTLDIRAERAGDYLPLLGAQARDLLMAERRRVSARVATLRQSLAALTDSGRRQADLLRAAAMSLAELDDTLRAT